MLFQKAVENNIAAIVESSGSTGTPKRISISTSALLHAARAGQERLGPLGQWLLALPINFIAGQQVLVRSLACRSTTGDYEYRGSVYSRSFLAFVAC